VGRFIQADTVIPQQQGVQAWDRYAYVNNSPVKYTDPTGHNAYCESENADPDDCTGDDDQSDDTLGTDLSEDDDPADDYDVIWFDVTLSPSDVNYLLDEITWWLEKYNTVDDWVTRVKFLSVILITMGVVPGVQEATPIGLVGVAGTISIDNWADDMEILKDQLALIKDNTTGSQLTMGADLLGGWGITLNSNEIICIKRSMSTTEFGPCRSPKTEHVDHPIRSMSTT
jgi:hypothetical protein